MKNLLKILLILLILKQILSDDYRNNNHKQCYSTVSFKDHVKFLCMYENLHNGSFFMLDLMKSIKKIECFGSNSNWELLNINYTFNFNQPKIFTIKNCEFNENTSLENVAKLIRAEKTIELYIKMFQSTNTLLNDNIFRGFDNLEKLFILSNHKLENLTDNTLKHFRSIKEIYFYNDSLHEIPENIFQPVVESLEIIEIAENSIEIIKPNTFRNLKKLKILNLMNNYLENIPLDAFQDLTNLEELNLFNNQLEKLPMLDKLKKLGILNIEKNYLEEIDENTFSGLVNLRVLNLSKNFLKILPGRIFHCLPKLEILNLNDNFLETISKPLLSIRSLQVFKAANNSIKTIDIGVFDEAINLTNITLSQNVISFSDFDSISIFSNCTKLRELNLSFNHIATSYNGLILLSEFIDLEILDISHNLISNFMMPVKLNNRRPFSIDLTYNQMMNSFMFSEFDNIEFDFNENVTVDIRENPISCSCSVLPLLKYKNGLFRQKKQAIFIETTDLKCSSPEEYREKLLSNININHFTCDYTLDSTSSSQCDMKCPMKVNFMKKFVIFNCENKRLTSIPENLCAIPDYKIELNLNNNFLTSIHKILNQNYENVTTLLVAKNRIKYFNSMILTSHKNLKVLDISKNLINVLNYIDVYMINLKLDSIKVAGNPFFCNTYYYANLRRHNSKIQDYSSMTCIKSQIWEKQTESLILREKNSICEFPIEKIYQLWGEFCSSSEIGNFSFHSRVDDHWLKLTQLSRKPKELSNLPVTDFRQIKIRPDLFVPFGGIKLTTPRNDGRVQMNLS